jgi:TM2 domain-containing membrane protein YozV
VPLEPSAWPEQPPPWPQQPPGRSRQATRARRQAAYRSGARGRERYATRPPPERYGQRYAPRQQGHEWTPLPLQDYEMQPVMVAPKSPAGSVLLSIFIPGLGSMVNDNARVGVTILILNIIGWILAIVLIGIPLALGSWIWGLVDAYQSAQRWNRAHGIVS